MGLGGHTCWVEEGKGREVRVRFHRHWQRSYYPGQPHYLEADREALLGEAGTDDSDGYPYSLLNESSLCCLHSSCNLFCLEAVLLQTTYPLLRQGDRSLAMLSVCSLLCVHWESSGVGADHAPTDNGFSYGRACTVSLYHRARGRGTLPGEFPGIGYGGQRLSCPL